MRVEALAEPDFARLTADCARTLREIMELLAAQPVDVSCWSSLYSDTHSSALVLPLLRSPSFHFLITSVLVLT